MDRVEQVLTSILEDLPGASMAAMLGTDGVGVQIALGDAWREADPEVAEVELAALAVAVQKAARRLGGGMSQDFFLSTAQSNFLGIMLDPSYFLVLGLDPTGDLDRAREALAQARGELEDLDMPSA